MYLLPSERIQAIERALAEFAETDSLTIYEPCDCGSRIKHNSSGNYHEIIHLRRDSGQVFAKYDTTCMLTPPAQWEERPLDPEAVIRTNADWL